MSLDLEIRGAAKADMAEAHDWYEGKREGLGDEFLTVANETFLHIQSNPEIYAAGFKGVRYVRMDTFPYVIYYRIASDCIEVLAVIHGSRSPRIWRSRAR